MAWFPKNTLVALTAIPGAVAWLSVILVGSGLGRLLGETLDLFDSRVPQGFGTEWSKLLSVMGGCVGIGFYVGVLING